MMSEELCECGCPKSQHSANRGCETEGCECEWFTLPCKVCGTPFSKHDGLQITCRKYHDAKESLKSLLQASEKAISRLKNEFGSPVVKDNFEDLLTAVESAKKATSNK